MKARNRELTTATSGMPAMDGAGVRMTRIIGAPELNMLDPFLLFDNFESDNPGDYIGGFPDHPHRGFETVTYLLAGRMRHRDSAGNEGVIEAGGVQWMTAGKGIIHSEMPEQEQGLLQGFQLWVNLPADEKMREPAYQEFTAGEVAVEQHDNGIEVRVIAGMTDKGTQGPVSNDYVNPVYMDVVLPEQEIWEQNVDAGDNTFIFVVEGRVVLGDKQRPLAARQLGILRNGDRVRVQADSAARFLLVSARPLNEPVARSGPFVMNTSQQVMQAYEDFANKRFTGV